MRVAVLWQTLTGYVNAELKALDSELKALNSELKALDSELKALDPVLKALDAEPGVALFVADDVGPNKQAPFSADLFAWIAPENRFAHDGRPDAAELLRRVEAFQPDVLFVASWSTPAYNKVCRHFRGRALRVTGMDNQWRGTLKQRLGVLTAPFFVRRLFDCAWVAGDRQRVFAEKLGFAADRIWKGFCSPDSETFRAVRLAPGTPRSRRFLFAGRLVAEKGVDVLLAAYERYRQSVAEAEDVWELHIAGSGPLAPSLQAPSLQGRPGVVAHGFLQPDAMAAVFGAAGCFVLPSVFEPWGVAIQEATVAGLPVLCSAACGAGDQYVVEGRNGYVVQTGSVESLTQAMMKIAEASQAELQAMSSASLALSEQITPQLWAQTLVARAAERLPSRPRGVQVTVLNSSHPELDQLASELALRGRLRQYFGRYFPGRHAWERLFARNLLTRRLFAAGPGRRRLPPELEETERHQSGVLWDFAAGIARRVAGRQPFNRSGEWMYRALQRRRDRAIVRYALQHGDPRDPVVANYSVALEVFERAAPGTLRLLNYPTAHHAYTAQLLAEEAALHPEFAADLAAQTPDARLAARLDRECALASRILVGSTFAKDTFVASGVPESKLIVCPYGVEVEDFASGSSPSSSTSSLPKQDETFRAVWVGQVTQRKGIRYLLEAWRRVQGPRTELVVAGNLTASAAALDPYAGLFRYAGFLGRDDLRRLLQSASVFVLPTLVEGMAATVLQAMAAGVPVIVTPQGAGDIVRDGLDGFVVPLRDASAIAGKLLLLRDDPGLREQMGRSARQRAQAFSWERYRCEAAQHIESLLSRC